MLHRVKALKGCALSALSLARVDGDAGKIKDFYFDDVEWALHYVVAEAGSWFHHNRILYAIAPRQPQALPMARKEDSVAALKFDRAFRRHQSQTAWLSADLDACQASAYKLRCTRDLIGCSIHSADGEIGSVEDFVIDDTSMTIRYVVVDTSDSWRGKQTLVAVRSIEAIEGIVPRLVVNLPCETVKHAPELIRGSLITPDYESVLTRHYRRKRAVAAF